MADWRKGILLVIVALIAVIQVIPQVDLPDTTSHEDNLPVIEKARLAVASALFVGSLQRATAANMTSGLGISPPSKAPLSLQGPSFLPAVHFTLLC
jgi:hypothetical protein